MHAGTRGEKGHPAYIGIEGNIISFLPEHRSKQNEPPAAVAAAHLRAVQAVITAHGSFAVAVDGSSVGPFDVDVREMHAVLAATEALHPRCSAVYVTNPNSWTKVGRGVMKALGYTLADKIVLQ